MLNHKPFHQKYRPSCLDELVGQELISTTLKQALLSNKVAPAYLFNGPRGTGKTSSARIFAKSLNCQSYDQPTTNPCGKCELCLQIADGNALDIIEIDAASNTGVENIREIIDRARFAPTQARWKVYVIDECHMLSTAASNALLKTIEEPPSRVVFILATTNPERVLTTIQSRCQKFDFRRIKSQSIFQHLSEIAAKESIHFEDEALQLIAKRSNGGMRDAQSLLDQLSLLPDGITIKNVQNFLGEVSEIDLKNLISSLIDNNPEILIITCNKLYDAGKEPNQIIIGLLNITRDLLLHSINNKYTYLYYTSAEFQSELNELGKLLNKSRIIDWHNKLKNIEYQIKTSDNPRLWLEIHLTSLLETQDIKNRAKNQNKKNNSVTIQNQELSNENVEIKQDISNKEVTNNDLNIEKKRKSDSLKDVKLTNTEHSSQPMTQNNGGIDLKEKWELILSKLELPSTKMLLSQQAELESVDSTGVVIALSPNWENMIKSRKVIIESAVKKIFGDQIKINFSKKKVNRTNSNNTQEKINTQKNYAESTKKGEANNFDLTENLSSNEAYDKSSTNLANFFNGEIVELD